MELVIIIAIVAAIFIPGIVIATRSSMQKQQRLEEARAAYDEALDYLEAHPTDPKARRVCLERGRVYYAVTDPDIVSYVIGERAAGVTGISNNSAAREAKIASDIEARIGHLKVGA